MKSFLVFSILTVASSALADCPTIAGLWDINEHRNSPFANEIQQDRCERFTFATAEMSENQIVYRIVGLELVANLSMCHGSYIKCFLSRSTPSYVEFDREDQWCIAEHDEHGKCRSKTTRYQLNENGNLIQICAAATCGDDGYVGDVVSRELFKR